MIKKGADLNGQPPKVEIISEKMVVILLGASKLRIGINATF